MSVAHPAAAPPLSPAQKALWAEWERQEFHREACLMEYCRRVLGHMPSEDAHYDRCLKQLEAERGWVTAAAAKRLLRIGGRRWGRVVAGGDLESRRTELGTLYSRRSIDRTLAMWARWKAEEAEAAAAMATPEARARRQAINLGER